MKYTAVTGDKQNRKQYTLRRGGKSITDNITKQDEKRWRKNEVIT